MAASGAGYVACGLEGPIVYYFKEGSNSFWTAVQVRNHRYPIAKLEWLMPGGSHGDAQLPACEM